MVQHDLPASPARPHATGHVLATVHDMAGEHRIISAVGAYWSDAGEGPLSSTDPMPAGDFLGFADVVERYATRTGRDLTDVGYYVAFANWRLASPSRGCSPGTGPA